MSSGPGRPGALRLAPVVPGTAGTLVVDETMVEVWIFRLLLLAALAAFVLQMAKRLGLIMRARNNFSLAGLPIRLRSFFFEVVLQSRTIKDKPAAGLAHAFVFWGFMAFAGYTAVEFLHGLGVLDLTGTDWFRWYSLALVPFAIAVLGGIGGLLVRRAFIRPAALSLTGRVSIESILIGGFIIGLMVTFLLAFGLDGPAARVNWWVHALLILSFLVLIPGSKHLHLLLSPVTVLLRSPRLGTVPNLDFEKEEVGLETVNDLEAKQVLDAFTCVECGRCQDRCPAFATGKALNPKKLILQNEAALLGGQFDRRLADVYDEEVLWQCTTCGGCEDACPVGIEHLPLIIGARRGLVSNGEAPAYLGAVYNQMERRSNPWGFGADQREKFVAAAGVEIFDPARHDCLVWLGCAGAFEPDFQRSLRALFRILGSRGVRFGVLARERCTGDPAKRTGNEYLFQELAAANVKDLAAAERRTILTSCPHCLKTLDHDYRAFGFEARVRHTAEFVEELTRGDVPARSDGTVTFHDPCYLARYAGDSDSPRALLTRFGGSLIEPAQKGRDTFCCGAGGGLLFEDKEEKGKRISQERFDQLERTGAATVVMGCPFCSIMLKGAEASSDSQVSLVDLMTWVDGRLQPQAASSGTQEPSPERPATADDPGFGGRDLTR